MTGSAKGPTLELDIDPAWGDSPGPPYADWDAWAQTTAAAAAAEVPPIARRNLLVSLVLGDDEEVHALNKEWRDRDRPTNVLSFPMLDADELADIGDAMPIMLGDIVMAHGVCLREADEKSVALAKHATHLLVHGLLHLAGYDHETSEADAEEMEALEVRILARLGIADPYGDRE
ncbi:rRNA maturation RNase YbeY [Croceicoccus sp. BE223]|uniref:rRNA maturation RNase YbeY n=1 Tax=Croceicoccus sp. BE223 TaxID=2817716 RepID=UPI0028552B79|nr:rRNA maturation RNase YbeY [Croceicoccus sp. BE223]MDR7102485.1 putative rRNA maturation factor [Croceicoccus sp. BE223]